MALQLVGRSLLPTALAQNINFAERNKGELFAVMD